MVGLSNARLGTGLCGDECEEWCVAAVQGFEIPLLGIRGFCLPTTEQDANPLEGQAAESGVVAFAA